jgi:microcystin degradation protein MlrC
MRIAIAGLHIEACTFSPLRSGAEDFTIRRGDALLSRYAGFIGKYEDVTFVPLIHARAIPGGPIARDFYDANKSEVIHLLQDGAPWDGVLLDMHGAAAVEGLDDAEGDWIAAVRNTVGANTWLVASYDLHGNLSRRAFDALDALTAYRTAPHVDVEQTAERAFDLLIDGIRSGERYAKAFQDVPVALPGEVTSTEWEPGTGLYAAILPAVDGANVIDASILVGYVWADEPRARASVVAYGRSQDAVSQSARSLARRFWHVRSEFQFGVPALHVDEAIEQALRADARPVFISDSGDNPTAGGVGDVPVMLARLLAHGVPDAVFASIADTESVSRCFDASVGATIPLNIGGKLDRVNGEPLSVRAEVVNLVEMPYRGNPEQRNRHAVVRIDGVLVVLTERRTPFHTESDFQRLGIEPTQHQIVVIKVGYLEPDLKRMAGTALLALSPGVVNQAIARLPFERIQRPIYPLDQDTDWHPA